MIDMEFACGCGDEDCPVCAGAEYGVFRCEECGRRLEIDGTPVDPDDFGCHVCSSLDNGSLAWYNFDELETESLFDSYDDEEGNDD